MHCACTYTHTHTHTHARAHTHRGKSPSSSLIHRLSSQVRVSELEQLLKSAEKERETVAHQARQMSDKLAVMQSTNEEVRMHASLYVCM